MSDSFRLHGRAAVGSSLALAFIVNACGGKSNSVTPPPAAGGVFGDSGSPGAGVSTMSASGQSGAGGRASDAGAGGVSAGGSSAGAVAGGLAGQGLADGGRQSVAGAGGEAGSAPECLDVCEREGEACCFAGAECVSPFGSCIIEVLAGTIDVTKDYDVIAERVAELPPDLLLSLSDADVVSARIEAQYASRLEIVLSAEASDRATPLEQAALHPFRVSCAGQELFVGLIYEEIGAAAIAAPVIHVSRNAGGRAVLRFGAWQSAWPGLSAPSPGDAPLRQRLDRPELRAALCRDGVLTRL